MDSPSNRATARARLFQLLAWGFSYPLPELVDEIREGAYGEAVESAHQQAFGVHVHLPRCGIDFPTWEAQYTELFDVGARGKPCVSLCSGDDEDLLGGKGRPEFLLEFVRWYSAFGLKLRQEAELRELPDHLTCQLEFLAWLAHLEAGSTPGSELALGYRQAQRDFCWRCLRPFASRLAAAVGREVQRRNCDPFFAAIAERVVNAVACTEREMEADARASHRRSESDTAHFATNEASLWGDQT